MKKDTKAMIILIGGIAVVGASDALIPQSLPIPGLIVMVLGLVMFFVGACWTLKSIGVSAVRMLRDANANILTPRKKLLSLVGGLIGLSIVGFCAIQLIRIIVQIPQLLG